MHAIAIGPERLGDFVALPRRLHGSDPLWVPPLELPLLAELTGQDAFARHARMQPFLAVRDSLVVGRAVALVNDRLRDASGRVVGQVGYFECEDDAAAAGALFEAAGAWLRAQGAREVLGPMNGGAHRAHRLMTRGFDRDPFLLEPRNPAYYVALFLAHGFRRVHTWGSFELSRETVAPLAALVERAAGRSRETGAHVGVHLGARSDLAGIFTRIHPLLDRAWAGHVGYTPLDADELAETFAGLLSIMDEKCVGLVRRADGRNVAFAFMYPDYVNEVRALAGDVRRWGEWLGKARARRLILHTVAVVPEERRTPAPFMLLREGGLRYFEDGGFDELLVALVTEEFRLFERVAEPTREYALFGKAL